MKLIGELIEVIAGRAGLGNVREVGETLTKSGVQTDRIADAAGFALDVIGSDLLDYGQMIIGRMKNTTGQGDPTRGDVFGQGQSAFQQADTTLQSAAPNDRWVGSAAHAYADQNGRQQLRSEAMADADHEVHKVIYRESAQITLRRRFLDDQSADSSYTLTASESSSVPPATLGVISGTITAVLSAVSGLPIAIAAAPSPPNASG